MEKLGYSNSYEILDARDFGLPQARERVFTVSVLNGERFDFSDLIRTPMKDISEFLLNNNENCGKPERYMKCMGYKERQQAAGEQKVDVQG